MLLRSDFNLINPLERCFNLKRIKSAEIIIDHIYTLDDKAKFHSKIMKVLPRILSQERISPNFLHFLRIPTKEENLLCLE